MTHLPPREPRWRVRLLGAVAASDGRGTTLARFGSAAAAALLARLALHPGRAHAREELIDLLWPEVALETGRNRLRQTLFVLRHLLEPPQALPDPVLVADRASISVVAGALACDATELKAAVRAGRHAEALALDGGELMPGHYAEWVQAERQDIDALLARAAAAESRRPASAAAGDVASAPAAPLPADPPAAARRDRSRLPVWLTRWFGRDADLARLGALLAEERWVTLTGAGGSGKSRLAAAACAGWPAGASGGIAVFVPLADCVDRETVLDAIVAALRLPAGRGDPLMPIVDALDDRPALLALDNAEHVHEPVAEVVAALLVALPSLRVVVTSRRPLEADGERQFAVPPLALPALKATLAEAAANPALQLFVDRARAVRLDFQLHARNRATLVELVRVLGGSPLAIELAAARVRSHPPAEMLALLRAAERMPGGATLDFLARGRTGRTGAQARHASMEGVIDWSWNLLTPDERRVLAELTVFTGPFDSEAAAALTAPGARAPSGVLDGLVAQSLLEAIGGEDVGGRSDGDGSGHRFALNQAVREFAAARLADGDAASLRARHRRWWTERGEAHGTAPPPALLRNGWRDFAAALTGAIDDGAPEEALALAVAWRRGLPDVAAPPTLLERLSAATALCGDGVLPSRGHALLARLFLAAGAPAEAARHAATGLVQARRLDAGEPARDEVLARALHAVASVTWRRERDPAAAEALLDEADPIALRSGDPTARAGLLALRGFITNLGRGDPEGAQTLHARALALWEQAGDAVAANSGRYNLAVCSLRARRFDDVLQQLPAIAREAERQHDWRLRSQVSNIEGEAHVGRRDWAGAAAAYRASLELAWSDLAQPSVAHALWNLPYALVRVDEADRAVRLGAASVRFWETHMGSLAAVDRRDVLRLQRLAGVRIGAAAVRAAWREGAALSVPDVIALALDVPSGETVPTRRSGG